MGRPFLRTTNAFFHSANFGVNLVAGTKKAKVTRIVLILFILLLFSLPSFLFSSSYAMMRNEEWLDWEMTN